MRNSFNLSKNVISLSTNSTKNSAVKDFNSIPGPKPSLPIVGTGWQYFKYIGKYDLSKLHLANLDKYLTYGSIVKETYGWKKAIIHIFDPQDYRVVYTNQNKCPFRPPKEFVRQYRSENEDKYENVGLADMNGEQWYRHRLLLAPALMSLKTVDNHITAQNKVCDDFISYLLETRDKSSEILIDLQDATYRLALESICMMCLDSRMQCLSTLNTTTTDGSLLITATKRLFESYNELYYGIPIWKFFPTKSYKKLADSESSIYNITSKYVEIAFNKLKKSCNNIAINGKHESVLQTLIKTDGLSEKEVRTVIIDFIAGGIFTVSNTLSFIFYHLAKNMSAQKKLYDEINNVIGNESTITTQMLSKLPYLKACVKECFRISPTVPGIMRISPQDFILSGYHVPAGTIIVSHFMVTCQLSKYFENAHIFRPERWLGDERKQLNPFSMLPFGHGNRMCVGRRFAELELYMATAKLIQTYKLEAINPKVDLTHSFIVIPAHPISLKLTLRKSLKQ